MRGGLVSTVEPYTVPMRAILSGEKEVLSNRAQGCYSLTSFRVWFILVLFLLVRSAMRRPVGWFATPRGKLVHLGLY